MTKDEIIVAQLDEIIALKTKVENLEKVINDIELLLICIGGPLNDNVYGYSKDQLKIFFEIYNEIKNLPLTNFE